MVKEISNLEINEETLPTLKEIARYMPGGFFIYSATGSEEFLFFNERMIQYLECKNAEEFKKHTHNSFKYLVHPEDIDDVEDSIAKQIKDSDDNIDHVKYRVITKKGNIRWFNDYGHFVHSKEYGDIYYVFIEDITETKRIEEVETAFERISEEQKKLEHLVERKKSGRRSRNKAFVNSRILLVDPDELTRIVNRGILEEEGADVFEADNGAAALRMVKKHNAFDAILMEIDMPVMNGIEATKAIRALETDTENQTPIVILSSNASDDLIDDCIQAGANDYMDKPFVVSEFSRILIYCMREQSDYLERKLADTIKLANTDVLTNVKNIAAYTEKVADLSKRMSSKDHPRFGVVMCDINGLKQVNDSNGHDTGDSYIKNCCRIICNVFVHSPVYRIGGDEFVVVLQNIDYQNRDFLMEKLYDKILDAEKIDTIESGKASFAAGMAVYDYKRDYSFADVVKRADATMYKYKEAIKR